jgi:hypothetical protein
MTEFELKLCEQMQMDGNCSGVECRVCQHMMKLLITIELLKSK